MFVDGRAGRGGRGARVGDAAVGAGVGVRVLELGVEDGEVVIGLLGRALYAWLGRARRERVAGGRGGRRATVDMMLDG